MLASSLVTAVLAGSMQLASTRVCLLHATVEFSKVHLKYELADTHLKKSIVVAPPIDCKTGKFLRPNNLNDSVKWLDLSLPIEYKMSALKGPYINTYKHGGFAVSAERDLGDFFSRIWGLDNQTFCRTISTKDPENRASTCFMKILEEWRKGYEETPATSSLPIK
ncbi:MAG: hypothetical protein ACYC9L_03280 [Sulfuricaulis sp.]